MPRKIQIKRKITTRNRYYRSSVFFTIFLSIIGVVILVVISFFLLYITLKKSTLSDSYIFKNKLKTWGWSVNRREIERYLENPDIFDTFRNNQTSKLFFKMTGLDMKLTQIEDLAIVNPHPFQFILNPQHFVCQFQEAALSEINLGIPSLLNKPLILIYVHTSPKNYHHRMVIRETWGSDNNFDNFTVRTLFMCGLPENHEVQKALNLEYDLYKDIVQENFIDSYRNLSYKGIMALRWITNYCKEAHYIIKTDDDIFVNIFKLLPHLEKIREEKLNILEKVIDNHKITGSQRQKLIDGVMDNTFICNVWEKMKVIRNPKSKWYVSRDDFAEDYFTKYCSGSVYILTPSLASKLYRHSYKVPFFWVDDYYITGLIPSKLPESIKYESINGFYFLSSSEFLLKFTQNSSEIVIGHSKVLNHHLSVWKTVLSRYFLKNDKKA